MWNPIKRLVNPSKVSLGFKMHACDLWCKITGGLVHDIARWLELWSKQINASKEAMPTYVLKDDSLWILGGLLAVLIEEEILDLGDVNPWPQVGPELHDLESNLLTILRPYQVNAVCAALSANLGRGVLEVPTGGGKTFLAAGLAAASSATGMYRWLYLAPNTELAAQTDRTMREILPNLASALNAPPPEITCTTYSRANRFGDSWDGIICDECHRLACRTHCIPFSKLRARWRIGMSGTPLDRQDDRNALVIGLLGPVLYKIELHVLEHEGHLARGLVKPIYFNHLTGNVTL